MVGQHNNIRTIMQWRINRSVPRFIIIEGAVGSGRLTLSKTIVKLIGTGVISENNSKESVNKIISMANSIIDPTVYIFRDVDDMHVSAKNALLKVVEEPPNKAYFIMTVQDISNLLGTLESRAVHIKMEPYSLNELSQFCIDDKILKYATSIGEVITWKLEDIESAENVVNDCYEALMDCKRSKLLKATTNLRSKIGDSTKLDCSLFMQVFARKLIEMDFLSNCNMDILDVIEKCKKEFKVPSINKKYSIEVMLMNMMEALENADIS